MCNNKHENEQVINETTSLCKLIYGFCNCKEYDVREWVAGDKGETELKDKDIVNIAKNTEVPECEMMTDGDDSTNCDGNIEPTTAEIFHAAEIYMLWFEIFVFGLNAVIQNSLNLLQDLVVKKK